MLEGFRDTMTSEWTFGVRSVPASCAVMARYAAARTCLRETICGAAR